MNLSDQYVKNVLGFALDRISSGEPHRHHSSCIHNLSADEQIASRGRTREWWNAMDLPEPVVITPDDWETEPPDFGPMHLEQA